MLSKLVFLSSLKMAAATFSSRILGLVREQAIAQYFGASGLTDAFNIAFRIPNILRDLFAEGAFSSAFVPIFTEAKQISQVEARRLLWALFVLLGSVTTFLSLLIFIFAPELLELFTDELFTSSVERRNITILLIRIMSPFLLFVSLAALFMGVLNSLKVFFLPALAPALFNVVMIISIIFVSPWLASMGHHSILSLGVGVLVGGFVQMLFQLPPILKRAYGPVSPGKIINDYTKRVFHRVGIGTIGIAATQINILITTILATGTVVGAVSWLNYAFRLFQFPVGILSVSIAGSNLVHFSDAWKSGRIEEAKSLLKSSYFLSLVTIVPAFCLLYVMSTEAVNLVYQRGAFNLEDTTNTASALRFYLYGLPFYGLYKIFAPTFFTLDHPKVPIYISVTAILFNIVFCVLLVPKYGFVVLALGTTLSMLLNCLLQSFFLKKYLDLDLSFFIDLRVFKVFLSGLVCFFSTQYLIDSFYLIEAVFLEKLLRFCFLGAVGAGSYAFCLLLLGELSSLKLLLKRKH